MRHWNPRDSPPSDRTFRGECTVVIPVYKPVISDAERFSLTTAARLLKAYPLVIATHKDLDQRVYRTLAPAATFEYFPAHFFEDIHGYNRLMLSRIFYERFASHENILLYQLDAFVFSDQLHRWCKRGFSYIGSPWLGVIHYGDGWQISPWAAVRMFCTGRWRNGVGNGGFSLRHVPSFLRVLNRFADAAAAWSMNEDYFWSLAAPYWDSEFRLPSTREAIYFGFERNPQLAFRLTRGQLPFGCHAWEKHDPEFWKQFISPNVESVIVKHGRADGDGDLP